MSRGGLASTSDEEFREPRRRSLRLTSRGVRIIEFHAAYRSFFLSERILAGLALLESSTDSRSTKAQCPSQVWLRLYRRTHHFVDSRNSCKVAISLCVGSPSISMIESLLVGSSGLFEDTPSIQSTPTSMNGTTAFSGVRWDGLSERNSHLRQFESL
jgi:hypothetical protein